MRTIKFRALTKEQRGLNRVFIYWKLGQTPNYDFLDFNTVGEFTGLLDKNGKEIYDGDILHSYGELFSNFGQYPTGKYATSIYKVVWVGDGWGHKTLKSKTQVIGYESRGLKVMASLTDVIGNIYENPELLKERV